MSNLLRRSLGDLKVAKQILPNRHEDECYVDIACFHLQQAFEKALKYWIEMKGYKYPFTHDIDSLLKILDAIGCQYPEELSSMGFVLTTWATQGKYGSCSIAQKKA